MIAPTVFAKHPTIALEHINIIVKYYANILHNKPLYASCKSPSSDICYKCLCLAIWPCFHTTYTYTSDATDYQAHWVAMLGRWSQLGEDLDYQAHLVAMPDRLSQL